MNNLIQIFDILASILTVVSLNLVMKSYKFWLLYIVSCIFFIIVCVYNSIWGLTCMGIFLLGTGIRNYYLGYRAGQLNTEMTSWDTLSDEIDVGSGL